jgi:hypothetical protein
MIRADRVVLVFVDTSSTYREGLMTAVDRRTAFRRTRRTAVGVGCAVLLSFVLTKPGGAAPDSAAQRQSFNNGTGSALALGYKANPTNGNLSFGITAGESVAGHQNTGATGQARAINLGVIGVTLAGEGCDGGSATLPEESQPQPVIARSGEKGADSGYKESEQGAIEKFARATTAPFAEAITTIAPSGDPAAAYLSGGRTISSSGIVDGTTREAIARTEIDGLSLGGGAVRLRGMTWEAIHRSGAVNETVGTFSIDGIEIAGQKIPVSGDPVKQLASLGPVLAPLGFAITAPEVRVEQGIVFVDPMSIAVVPSPTRDGITAPIIGGAQPLRDAVTEALLEQDCGNSTYITVADIVLGGVSGAGQVGLELGGVQATTAEIDAFQFALPPALGAAALSPSVAAPGIDAPSLGAPAAAPSAGSGGASAQPTPSMEPVGPVAALAGERGGLMALIAGGGLLTLLATAEGDRRKMRNAQRAIPLEA